MLQIIMIPRDDASLQCFWHPHFTVECGDRDAVDYFRSDDVAISPGLLGLLVEFFALCLSELYLLHVEWEVVIDIPVEVGDSK